MIARGSRSIPPAVRRWLLPTCMILLCACPVVGTCADDSAAVPLAPAPEDQAVDAGVQPAAFPPPAVPRATTAAPLPLAASPASADNPAAARPIRPLGDWSVLAAIAAAFVLLAAFRLRPLRKTHRLPPDVFELLGEGSLGGPHAVRVVRFGPRTLLIGVSAAGCQTLAELDDPQATERIVAACQGERAAPRRSPARAPAGPRSRPPGTIDPDRVAAGLVLWGVMLAGSGFAAEGPAAANTPAAVVASLPATDVVPLTPLEATSTPTSDVAAGDTGEPSPPDSQPPASPPPVTWNPGMLLEGRSLGAILPSVLLFGVATLAPAVLLMTTCFVRISVVLGLVRQGLGAAQVPGNQVVASLAIFLSALVMWPVWTKSWNEGVKPYQEGTLAAGEAFERGSLPIRRWMAAQIEEAGNRDTMLLFLARHPGGPQQAATYDDVPPEALLPAFLVSELEVAFAIGFRLLLPFLVLDILVATLAASTGLVMLPPTLVSLPLKLLVFVAADGWTLVVRGLLDGFATG